MAVRLGELLLREKRITPAQLQEALNHQKANGGKLGMTLVKLGMVKDEEITALLSRQYGVPFINLAQFDIDASVLKLIPAETAQKYQIVPIGRSGATLTIAMTDPTNVFALDDIKFMTGYNVEPVVASETAVGEAIQKYYQSSGAGRQQRQRRRQQHDAAAQAANTLDLATRSLEDSVTGDEVEVLEEIEELDVTSLEKQGGEAPVIRMVNLLLMSSIQKGASDIHIEPYEREFRVRFRIDGILYIGDAAAHEVQGCDHLAHQDHGQAGHRREAPAAGRPHQAALQRQRHQQGDRLPRLVPADAVRREDRHASPRQGEADARHDAPRLRARVAGALRAADRQAVGHGAWSPARPAAARPTRSIRPSRKLNTMDTNIMTAEDPVEFNLPGVNQVNVKDSIGLNFAAALRSFLRQDPNIILVGEIRDFETAEIAVKAALTGHLVLSTLHTNDAPSTISRLMNMGIEPFLVASSVNLICAQRLVRRLCKFCKEAHPLPPQGFIDVGMPEEDAETATAFRPVGCDKCNNTGYKGRVGLYEVMEVSEELREMILVGASSMELRRKAREEGMFTLRESGLCKVREGVTSIEEVVRETVK